MNFSATVHVAFIIRFKTAVVLSVVKTPKANKEFSVITLLMLCPADSKSQYQSKLDASLCLDA